MAGQSILDNAAFIASRTGKTGYVAGGSSQHAMILAAVKHATAGYVDAEKVTMTSKADGSADQPAEEDRRHPFEPPRQQVTWTRES